MKNVIAEVLVFLFRRWKREWKTALAIALSMIVATVADLFLPVYSGRLVDVVVHDGALLNRDARDLAFHDALDAVAAMVVLGAVLIGGRQVGFQGICRLTTRIMTRMAADAFWRAQRFSSAWHANNFAGSIVRRITRGMWATDLMNDTLLLSLLPAVVALVGSAFVLGARWAGMGTLLVAASAVYITISVMLAIRYVAPAARLSNAQDTRLGGVFADSITCNAVVKAFGAESREDVRVDWILSKWTTRTYRTWMRFTLSSTYQGSLLLVLRTAIALYAVLLWRRGAASAGDVTFILTSYFVVHGYLRDVGQHVAHVQRAANDMEEMVRLASEPLGIEDRPGARDLKVTRGLIAFENVTFRYGAHTTPLFSNFSVTIRAGERVGLVGHSGSGKTTFVKLLHRLYDINEGRIVIDAQNVADVTQTSLRTQLALVPQEPILFHRSLAENIAYGRPDATLREIEEAARLANAHEFIGRQPKGYATPVGERGVKLSGGERQRVALARAFLANAPVLVLDEATSSLDAESEALIQDATSRLMAGRTAIVIAHRLSTVRILDRILVFDSGRIVEEGTHDELVSTPGGTYRRLFEKQALGLVADVEQEAFSARD
jgi:ATP-binding cassette subfamily B protein